MLKILLIKHLIVLEMKGIDFDHYDQPTGLISKATHHNINGQGLNPASKYQLLCVPTNLHIGTESGPALPDFFEGCLLIQLIVDV